MNTSFIAEQPLDSLPLRCLEIGDFFVPEIDSESLCLVTGIKPSDADRPTSVSIFSFFLGITLVRSDLDTHVYPKDVDLKVKPWFKSSAPTKT